MVAQPDLFVDDVGAAVAGACISCPTQHVLAEGFSSHIQDRHLKPQSAGSLLIHHAC